MHCIQCITLPVSAVCCACFDSESGFGTISRHMYSILNSVNIGDVFFVNISVFVFYNYTITHIIIQWYYSLMIYVFSVIRHLHHIAEKEPYTHIILTDKSIKLLIIIASASKALCSGIPVSVCFSVRRKFLQEYLPP